MIDAGKCSGAWCITVGPKIWSNLAKNIHSSNIVFFLFFLSEGVDQHISIKNFNNRGDSKRETKQRKENNNNNNNNNNKKKKKVDLGVDNGQKHVVISSRQQQQQQRKQWYRKRYGRDGMGKFLKIAHE